MAGSGNATAWENYPLCLPFCLTEADQDDRHQILERESARLFSGRDDVEIWTLDGSGGLRRARLDWYVFFKRPWIDLNALRTNIKVSFIHQRSTWGYLQISKDGLKRILHRHRFPSVILDAVSTFGSKVTHEDDPFSNLCYLRSSTIPDEPRSPSAAGQLDVCYILRRYEKHGRSDLKQPWSLRQMMVCQRRFLPKGKDSWIFIQPFEACKNAMWKRLPLNDHPLAVHALLLTISLSTWRWYLNDRRRSVAEYRDKATKSSLTIRQVDYETSFEDCQRLEVISSNLAQASAILQSTLNIANALRNQCRCIEAQGLCESGKGKELVQSLTYDVERLENFQRTAQMLSRQAENASHLLLKLLHFRKADLQNAHSQALRDLATASNTQSAGLQILNERMRKDSRSVKILTIAATAYLPASLIAALFSTNLIQIPRHVDERDHGLVVVDKAMWVYVLSSVLLTALMAGGVFLLDRRGSWQPS